MRKFGIVVLGFVLFTAVADAQQVVLDKIIAVIGNSVILQSDIEGLNAQYQVQNQHPDKCLLTQNLITQKLLVQQAAVDSIDVKEDELQQEIDRRMRSMTQRAGGQDKLEQFLGRSLLQYKEEIRGDVKEMMVAQKMQAHITEKLNTTPQDVRDYFRKIPTDSLPTFNKEVEVAEIVFEPKLSKEEKDIYRQKAQDLLDRIKKGEDFATLATAYSQDPGSAAQGGDVGFADRNTFVKEFTGWAFRLKAGEYSPVFESPDYGFFFLQVLERRGEQVHVRHILITPPITPESLDRAKGKADTIYKLVAKYHTPDVFSHIATDYSDDKETKYNGGLMLNPNNVEVRTSFIPTDKLDPQVALVVDTMKVGGVSKPVLYTDERGKKSYRIFYLKSVIDAHKANLEQDFPKIKAFATDDKINRTVSQWFAKKRKETYIKIDPKYQACPVLKDWATASSAQVNP
ncbi:peptidylprolyl isomerase [Mucilaginibacter sp. UR6-11]|uniref:peptidylprolyl isomerase n=1 Tax=Mucilaginibacter sp. UR6-11 TaxID=1435644 RepID=UPI001E352D50|nr:peptidylprolyl isomerase [Mucilaginibacter sp. UR6-11]MCC8424785.1 peptidylprolyl isomerase [Mucilaginibacter sp. UR6-11]